MPTRKPNIMSLPAGHQMKAMRRLAPNLTVEDLRQQRQKILATIEGDIYRLETELDALLCQSVLEPDVSEALAARARADVLKLKTALAGLIEP